MIRLLLTLFALTVPSFALAQGTAPPSSTSMMEVEMKTELIKVQYVEPAAVAEVLQGFTSHLGRIDHNRELGVVTVYDKPALVDKMIEVAAELDQPRTTLTFDIALVVAGPKGEGTGRPLEPDMKAVEKELRSLFSYASYSLLDRATIKTLAGTQAELQVGGAMGYQLDVSSSGRAQKGAQIPVRVQLSRPVGTGPEGHPRYDTIVSTALEVQDGETSVVGASRINGDEALVMILVTRVE